MSARVFPARVQDVVLTDDQQAAVDALEESTTLEKLTAFVDIVGGATLLAVAAVESPIWEEPMGDLTTAPLTLPTVVETPTWSA